jgi:hypothetical protein
MSPTNTRRAALRAATVLLATAATWIVSACGGGADPTRAQLRLVNASGGYAALDLRVDDDRKASSVAFGGDEDYVEVDPDFDDLDVTLPGSSTALASPDPTLREQRFYTLLAYGQEGQLKTVLLDDNASEPDSGEVKLRVVNAAPEAGNVDVYVTASGESLAAAVPFQANLAAGAVSALDTLDSGPWRIRVTAASDRTDLRLDVDNVTLRSGRVLTLVVAPTTGGVLASALLLEQEGSIGVHSGGKARVRVAAPSTGVVAATVGGVPVLDATAAPVVGDYELVDAGTPAVSLTVGGAAVSVPTQALVAGEDRTLLVYAANGTPAAAWLVDDNRPPTATGTAKVRFVHGRSDSPGALSLKINLNPAFSSVALGSASATYTDATAAANVRVTISDAVSGDTLFDVTDQTIEAGAVYSVFATAGTSPSAGFVKQDR